MKHHWSAFIPCLLISFSIWLVHNLSQPATGVVSVPVVARTGIEGRAAYSSEESVIAARVKASGFQLWTMSSRRPKTVHFDAGDFTHEGGDVFSIPASELNRYASDIFGSSAGVEAFLTQRVQFRFQQETSRKVPVKINESISFRPQYTATGEITAHPDSVVVYGEPSRLSDIEYVQTGKISMSDVHGSVHGVVGLQKPAGLRTGIDEVSWSLDVVRFIELKDQVRIEFRGVPDSVRIASSPSSVDVTYICAYPSSVDPREKVSFYVDYADFERSRTGKCAIKADNLPYDIIDCRFEPKVCECMRIRDHVIR